LVVAIVLSESGAISDCDGDGDADCDDGESTECKVRHLTDKVIHLNKYTHLNRDLPNLNTKINRQLDCIREREGLSYG
jgi:hypothetical protein